MYVWEKHAEYLLFFFICFQTGWKKGDGERAYNDKSFDNQSHGLKKKKTKIKETRDGLNIYKSPLEWSKEGQKVAVV